MKLRKTFAFLLAAALIFSLTACGGGGDSGGNGDAGTSEEIDFNITVGDTGTWEAFPGETGVVYAGRSGRALSDKESVLGSITASADGTTLTYTATKKGNAPVTATLNGVTITAWFRVADAE